MNKTKKLKNPCLSMFIYGLFFFVSNSFAQQKIAVLIPEKTFQSQIFAEKLENSLSKDFKILDDSLSETAFRSAKYEKPFNLSLEESKISGAAIGCDFFLLIKAENQRRYSLEKKEFYESFAVVYVVSSRTGRLVLLKLIGGEAETVEKAEKKMLALTNDLSAEISGKLKIVTTNESTEKDSQKLEKLPTENSPEAKNFRPPLPYKRLKPAYTRLANLYSVEATVDIEVDVDENGNVLQTQITRWAGFGLDESVDKTIRQMKWKPADRNGKTIKMRVLLRYNFKKLEQEEEK